jgi:hypothetical protein
MKDLVLTDKYSNTSDNEADIEIMSPSKHNNNNESQEMEAIDVSPTNLCPPVHESCFRS